MLVKKLISYSATSLLMAALGSLSMIALLSQNVQAAQLTVNVSEMASGKGHLMVALYAGSKAYQSGDSSFSTRIKVQGETGKVTFSDLPDGDYAIKIYQDENDNKTLDFNMLGIPKEGYGFSNNAGRFGQPSYEKAQFSIKDNTEIAIGLF